MVHAVDQFVAERHLDQLLEAVIWPLGISKITSG
jgi:hypothetical protein